MLLLLLLLVLLLELHVWVPREYIFIFLSPWASRLLILSTKILRLHFEFHDRHIQTDTKGRGDQSYEFE